MRPGTLGHDRSKGKGGGRVRRLWRMGVGALLAVLGSAAAWGESEVPELRVAFSAGVFDGLNRTDALASIKAWVEAVARQRGFQYVAQTKIYDSPQALLDAARRGEVNLVAVQSHEWLVLEQDRSLQPVFVPAQGEGVVDEILLLVRKDSGLVEVEQLRGKTMAAQQTAGRRLGELWIDHELRLRGLPGYGQFFFHVDHAEKPSGAVLSVFFGKHPACVMARKAFESAAELNPQLAAQLRPMLVSPPVVGAIVAVWSEDFPHKEELLAGLADLHQSVQGRQILSVFRISRLAPFEASLLQGVRSLAAEAPSVQVQPADRPRQQGRELGP